MGTTIAVLMEQSRQRADLENSEFITDAELLGLINGSYAELYDLMVEASEDYSVLDSAFTTVSGQIAYDLPADFYKLRGVDLKLNGSDYLAIKPFNFNRRNSKDLGYRLLNDELRISPPPTGATPGIIWYVPNPTLFTSDSDVVTDLNQTEYIVIATAIKMRIKEELEINELMALKTEQKERVIGSLMNRDVGESSTITDVNENYKPDWYWEY